MPTASAGPWLEVALAKGLIKPAQLAAREATATVTTTRPAALVIPAGASEKVFQAAVVKFAKGWGWMVYHTHDSRRSESGFPDLVMVRNGALLIAELKVRKNTTTPEQEVWLKELQAAGVVVFRWRPEQVEEIEGVLKGERP